MCFVFLSLFKLFFLLQLLLFMQEFTLSMIFQTFLPVLSQVIFNFACFSFSFYFEFDSLILLSLPLSSTLFPIFSGLVFSFFFSRTQNLDKLSYTLLVCYLFVRKFFEEFLNFLIII